MSAATRDNFEKGLINIIRHVTFLNKIDIFQRKVKEDISKIGKLTNNFVSADKSRNVTQINMTKTCRKIENMRLISNPKNPPKFNQNVCVKCLPKSKAFIRLKGATNNTKSELGKISKTMIDDINSELKKNFGLKLMEKYKINN